MASHTQQFLISIQHRITYQMTNSLNTFIFYRGCPHSTVLNGRGVYIPRGSIYISQQPLQFWGTRPAFSLSGKGSRVELGRQPENGLGRNVPQYPRPGVDGRVGHYIVPEWRPGNGRTSMLEHAQNVAGGGTLGVSVARLGVSVSVTLVLGAAVLEPHLHLANRT